VERGAVATAPAEQAVEKTARLTLPEGILVPLIRPERGQEKQAASAMPVFNFLPPVERPAQTAQTKEAPAPQTPPAQVAPREQAADCRAKGACALDDWARVIDSALDLSPAEKLDAVLLVRLNGKIKLLDNQKKTVADLADAPNYRPIYSLNQQNWWLHKKPEPVRLVPTRPARYAAQAAARQRFR
jgi:hypothetical protein